MSRLVRLTWCPSFYSHYQAVRQRGGDKQPSNQDKVVRYFEPSLVTGCYMKKALIALSVLLSVGTLDGKYLVYSAETPDCLFLPARVEVEIRNGLYTYKIINAGLKPVMAFHLDIKNIPIKIVGSPAGWQSDTDGQNWVLWITEDQTRMIPLAKSLDGFQIYSETINSVSTPYSLLGWAHSTQSHSSGVFGSVASPSK